MKLEDLTNHFSKFPVRVLDIGVGDAIYESLFRPEILKKVKIYGIDISSHQLKRAKNFLKEGKIVELKRQSIRNYYAKIFTSLWK